MVEISLSTAPDISQRNTSLHLASTLADKTEEISLLKSECDNAYDKGLTQGRATVESISKASYTKGSF